MEINIISPEISKSFSNVKDKDKLNILKENDNEDYIINHLIIN
jgi:hypothetical protein